MVLITGDIHGDIQRFDPEYYMGPYVHEGDTIIVCGDFGFVWARSEDKDQYLDRLGALPYTITFVTGNHENYDRLYQYPIKYWHGGRVRVIRPNILLLMRGEFFFIEGHSYFCMGGAACHDVDDGILEINDPDFKQKQHELDACRGMYRVNHLSWWKEELPLESEYENANYNLEKQGWQVDYVITHCAPTSVQALFSSQLYPPNELTDFLEGVSRKLQFTRWFFGHYHFNKYISSEYRLLYEEFDEIKPL